MKTIEIEIYSFDELTKEAQENAIENFKNKGADYSFIYNDAENTVNKFCEVFNVKTGSRSWLDCSTSHLEDGILNLTGFRLQKYLYNNFGNTLFKRKYLKTGKNLDNIPKKWHPMKRISEIKNGPNKGKFYVSYYSNLQKSIDCNLTGVCYDCDILDPIYKFLEDRNPEANNTTLKELFKDCFSCLKKSIENEIEHMESEEYITEELKENNFEFLKDGNIF
jgi:hypothetical protein